MRSSASTYLAVVLASVTPALSSPSTRDVAARDPDRLRDASSPVVTSPSTGADGAHDLAAFATLPADPRPAQIIRGVHYWVGNEDRIDVFAQPLRALRGQGGVHIGVGAEQNWVFAGWSRPDVVVLMDFDQAIVDLHHVYIAAFAVAPTRKEFRALFDDEKASALREAIVQRYPAGDVRDGALQALSTARHRIARRIGRLVAHLPARGTSSFLTDDDDYAFVRDRVAAGRVFVVRGDLTGPRTMDAIAAASRTAGLQVTSLYMSNAEQYFDYTKKTRKNLSSMPWAPTGLVLRTHGDERLDWVDSTTPSAAIEADLEYLPANKPKDNFHYGIQSGPSLQAFLASPRVDSALSILRLAPPTSVPGLSRLDDVDVAAAQRAAQARRSSSSHPSSNSSSHPSSSSVSSASTTLVSPSWETAR